MTFSRRRFLSLASAALGAPALSRPAFAADWPKDRVIHAIVPFSAGSTVDIIGRIVADPMAQALGQTIVIDNRGDAGGSRQHPLAATLRPIDPGGAPLGDQRGIKFGRRRISAGQGCPGPLGISFERQLGGVSVIGDM